MSRPDLCETIKFPAMRLAGPPAGELQLDVADSFYQHPVGACHWNPGDVRRQDHATSVLFHRPEAWADVGDCGHSRGYGSAPPLPYGNEFQDYGPGHFWYTGQFGGGLIPTIVIAGNGPRGVRDDTHYSLLRTLEQVWGLGYLGMPATRPMLSR